ncbi:MAG: hypothetical protein V4666_07205 [Bacteroidota bacterium]
MSKIGVVITDGVGFRNFILSDFIIEAKKKFTEIVIFSCLPKEVYEEFDFQCKVIELDVFTEKFPTWFFRKTKEVAHLQLHKEGNFGIQDNFNANKTKAFNPRGLATRFIFGFTNFLHSENWIQKYNKFQQFTFANNSITKEYEKLLIDNQIDLLFFTHQRPPYIAPLIFAAEKLKLKTSAFIFSWDNLASKNRMAGNFDKFLVWSDLMKQELLQFYKNVKPDDIEIVGTPQFEPYVLDRYKTTKQDWAITNQVDLNKKTIFFTCNDSHSKNDPIYLELIANFILDDKLSEKVNYIVRTSPAEEPTRFMKLAEKYPFIIWNFPDWNQVRSNHQESWSQRVPSINDVVQLRGFLEFSDVSVNVLSTISLDASLFNKPVINPVFGNVENGMFDDQKYLKYLHLDNVVKTNAVTIAKNEEELLQAINLCLSNPTHKNKEQQDLIKLQIGKPIENTSKNLVEVLSKWC